MRAGTIWFWILWGIDALVAAIFGYFFLVGIEDGSVSSFNLVLWMGILGFLAAVLGGGLFLKWKHHVGWGAALLCLVAVPAVGAGLLFAFILISNPRWN